MSVDYIDMWLSNRGLEISDIFQLEIETFVGSTIVNASIELVPYYRLNIWGDEECNVDNDFFIEYDTNLLLIDLLAGNIDIV